MKVNLNFIHLYNDYSGSPRVLRDAIDATTDSLVINEKVLFTSNHDGFLSDISNVEEINFFYRRSKSKGFQLLYYLLSQIFLFFAVSKKLLRSKFSDKNIDNIVVINTMLPFGGAIASKLFADKVIYYIHESHVSPHLLKRFLRWVIEFTSDDVIFVSNYLLKNEMFKNPNMNVIYNGLRNDFSTPSSIDFNYKYNSKNIIFSGSLKKYKGIDYLVELSSVMPDFNFIFVLNCTEQELSDYFSGVKLNSNIIIKLRPDDIEDIYSSGFAILNLSIPTQWTETFGLSILEGMNYGCVPVAPNAGGPLEIVNEKCGLLSEPSDIIKISNFLKLLSSDFNLWLSYSNASFERAKLFSSNSYKKNFIDYIESKVLP